MLLGFIVLLILMLLNDPDIMHSFGHSTIYEKLSEPTEPAKHYNSYDDLYFEYRDKYMPALHKANEKRRKKGLPEFKNYYEYARYEADHSILNIITGNKEIFFNDRMFLDVEKHYYELHPDLESDSLNSSCL